MFLTAGCNESSNQQTHYDTKPANKCSALLSYVDSLPPKTILRLSNGWYLPNGVIISDSRAVKIGDEFLMSKNDSECEAYCLLNKNEYFKIDFDKCENLKEIIDKTIEVGRVNI